jgi:hypothetical protein
MSWDSTVMSRLMLVLRRRLGLLEVGEFSQKLVVRKRGYLHVLGLFCTQSFPFPV